MACHETFESIIQSTAPGSVDRLIAPLFYRRIRRGEIRFQGVRYLSPELIPYEGLVAKFSAREGQPPQELCVQVESRTVRIRPFDELLQNNAIQAALDRIRARRIQLLHSRRPSGI